jgi:cobalt/nickel transport system permease protein
MFLKILALCDRATDAVRYCHGATVHPPPTRRFGRQSDAGSSNFGLPYEVFDETPYADYDGGLSPERSGFLLRPQEGQAMHIPDAVLDPKVAAATGIIGLLGLGVAVKKLEHQVGDKTTVLMGTTAAFVFAAQMVTFPVGPGVSGHLLGGVLAAVLLGPWAATIVIAAVLLVQCFLFGDGGLTALGANFINMGLIGAIGGYAIFGTVRRAVGGRRGVLVAAMVAAWFSVLLASGAFAIELVASVGGAAFFRILTWMVLVHAAIGLGEAIITGSVVRFLLVRRPDLFDLPDSDAAQRSHASWTRTAMGGLAIALAIAAFLAPFASKWPDGLEFVGEKTGFLSATSPSAALAVPIPEYEMPGIADAKVATALAGLIGTVVVFIAGWVMARALPSPRHGEASVDAA